MPKSARYHLFLLGLWPEGETGEWRFCLENPRTAERTGFRNLASLIQFLENWLHPQEIHMMTETQIQPLILLPGDGQPYSALGVTITPKTIGAQSDGQWLVVEYTALPHFDGPPPHWHKITTEIFYVLDGTLTLKVNQATQVLGPGGYAYIPPGTVHTFSNVTAHPVKYLLVASPAGLEHYFVELAELVRHAPQWPPADMSKVLALMAKYDTYPPIPVS